MPLSEVSCLLLGHVVSLEHNQLIGTGRFPHFSMSICLSDCVSGDLWKNGCADFDAVAVNGSGGSKDLPFRWGC